MSPSALKTMKFSHRLVGNYIVISYANPTLPQKTMAKKMFISEEELAMYRAYFLPSPWTNYASLYLTYMHIGETIYIYIYPQRTYIYTNPEERKYLGLIVIIK